MPSILFMRFIPAGTGNSSVELIGICWLTVHPRRYGELSRISPSKKGATGSSPQVRGTLCVGTIADLLGRFIPAGTGNSFISNASLAINSVHPRRYGELFLYSTLSFNSCGSSPQVRGTQSDSVQSMLSPRFIPAGTGNSTIQSTGECCTAVHPRRYGELLHAANATPFYIGSSPQVRGTPKV